MIFENLNLILTILNEITLFKIKINVNF